MRLKIHDIVLCMLTAMYIATAVGLANAVTQSGLNVASAQ